MREAIKVVDSCNYIHPYPCDLLYYLQILATTSPKVHIPNQFATT